MKKYEEAKKDLVLNGFDEAKVNELTNLFVEDFLDSEYEKLGESLDMYIDEVRDGQILPNEFGVVKFAEIVNDNEEKQSKSIVVSTFRNVITNKFNEMAKREPLQSVLVLGGTMEYHHDFAAYGFNPYVFAKDILVSFDDYGLCSIHPTGYEYGFIKISDLITLLNNKGLEKSFLLVEKNNGVGFDLLIEYDKIMSLGKTDELTLKRV